MRRTARSLTLVACLAAALGLAGCAAEGERITTGALKPSDGGAKPKRAKAVEAGASVDSKKLYCDDIRKSWKPGDLPPSEQALQKRKADNVYCSG